MHTPATTTAPIAVVGAGAAGLVAAVFAAGQGSPVSVFERTADGGRKILISGGGRCNILPSALDPSRYVSDSAPHLVRRLLRSWPLAGQREFFEKRAGLPLRLEPDTGKLFPVSDRARDVRDRLVRLAREAGAEFRFGTGVAGLEPRRGSLPWMVRLETGEAVPARAVILASGGLSVPSTGSDGLGLEIATRLGHTVHPTYPALTPLVADPPRHATLSGMSLDVTITAPLGHRNVVSAGGFLFTHRGYSGPAVLDISHLAVRSQIAGASPQPLYVRWSPLDPRAWDLELSTGRAVVGSILRRHLPARLAEALMREADVPGARHASTLRRDERRRLVERLTRYPLPWTGHEGYRKAEVTGGGVALEELEPRTLESRIQPGLFLCGEILDAFGPIGGHNFAWAWATGRTAGLGAAAHVTGIISADLRRR